MKSREKKMPLRLLDLFCGAGGVTRGYQQAGFHVTGVDCQSQPRYVGDAFVQVDALAYVAEHGQAFDVIHASPPCQAYSVLKHFTTREHPQLIEATRDALKATGKPWVIENVMGAPLRWPLLLCGSMFALRTPCGAELRRHRLFESPLLFLSPGECRHGKTTVSVNGHEQRVISVTGDHPHSPRDRRRKYRTISVTGSTPQQNVERNRIRDTFSVYDAGIAMGIDWMVMKELSQAIPPAYTEWIGRQLIQAIS